MNEGNGLVPYDGRAYNYAPINYIQTPYQRTNMFADGSFALTDSIEMNASVRGNFRQSAQLLAPLPYDSRAGLDPGYQGVFNGVPYNGISEDNYLPRAGFGRCRIGVAAGDRRAPPGRGNDRAFTQEVHQIQTNFGLNGDLGNDMHWDVYYNWGYRNEVDRDFGQMTGSKLAQALGPSADLNGDGTPECYGDIADPTSLIAGCVPMNFVGGAGTITRDMLDWVSADLSDTRVTEQHEAVGSISGSWFDLPGGTFGWAGGVAYTDTKYRYTPDSPKHWARSPATRVPEPQGSLIGNAVFAEFNAPVFDNDSQALNLRGSVRYDSYTTFDSEITWSAGLEFQVLQESEVAGNLRNGVPHADDHRSVRRPDRQLPDVR